MRGICATNNQRQRILPFFLLLSANLRNFEKFHFTFELTIENYLKSKTGKHALVSHLQGHNLVLIKASKRGISFSSCLNVSQLLINGGDTSGGWNFQLTRVGGFEYALKASLHPVPPYPLRIVAIRLIVLSDTRALFACELTLVPIGKR